MEATGAASDEAALVARLRAGDEAAYRSLVEALHPALRRHGRSARVLPGVAGSLVDILTRRSAYGRARP